MLNTRYVEVVLKFPMRMERKLLTQIMEYSEYVSTQERYSGGNEMKPEWLA